MDRIALTGGTVIDGTGQPGFAATVVMNGDRIAQIIPAGEPVPDDCHLVDCEGRVVTPGFIDMHSHEFTVMTNRRARSKIAQGCTTEVMGNCGMSNAPAATEAGLQEVTERICGGFGLYEGEVTWRTFEEYFELLEGDPAWTNTVQLCGLGTVRANVMGYDDRAPSPEEMEMMKALVDAAMEAGCRGVSTGLIYPPGIFSTTDEIVELASVAAVRGGLYFSHIRGESDTVVAAVEEVVEIARRARIGCHMAHFKIMGRHMWGTSETTRRIVADANEAGLDITYDVYPYAAASTVLSSILPDSAHAGGIEAMQERLGDPAERAAMRKAMARGCGISRGCGFEDILIVHSAIDETLSGRTVADIAEDRGIDPYDAAFDIIREEPLILMVLRAMDPDEVAANALGPHGMIGSDGQPLDPEGALAAGKPHPRSYGTFPRAIKWLVREEGKCSLEEMIHRMTGKPAGKLGLDDRGFLQAGAAADIVVFDPERIADTATFTEPHSLAEGIDAIYVAGSLSFENGRPAGEPEGRVIRYSA